MFHTSSDIFQTCLDMFQSSSDMFQARLNALKKLTKIARFKTRLMVANGIFMSKVIYLIALWGGCETYLLKSLQIVQNKAARAVTKLSWDTPIKTLLLQCNWMSVNQLVFYHSVVTLHKVIHTEYPKYLHNKVMSQFPYNTRQKTSNAIRIGPQFDARLDLAQKSFRWRSVKYWNNVPDSIRKITKTENFKKLLKNWVLNNVPVHSEPNL